MRVTFVKNSLDVHFEILDRGFKYLGHGACTDGSENKDEFVYLSKDGTRILVVNFAEERWWLFLKREKEPPLYLFRKVSEAPLVAGDEDSKAVMANDFFLFVRTKDGWFWRCRDGDIPFDDIVLDCTEEHADNELNYVLTVTERW